MRRAFSPILVSARTVRRRPLHPPSSSEAEFLKDSTTFADLHQVATGADPQLPYTPKGVQLAFEQSTKEALKAKRAKKFSSQRSVQNELVFDHIPLAEHCVLLFPGQGAQFVGMGKQVIDFEPSRRIFEEASELLGYDLLKLCLEGPKTKLDQTIYCQPAVFTAEIAAWTKLKHEDESVAANTTDVAGFSVGEFAALVAGGMFDFRTALEILKVRAEAMHECNQIVKAGMATVKVNAASQLEAAMKAAQSFAAEQGEIAVCDVANYLFCGVKVVGGSEKCLQFLEDNQRQYKFRIVKRVAVSGAFHTKLMADASKVLRDKLKEIKAKPAECNVYSNYTGKVYSRKQADIRAAIWRQVVEPVKWEQIQQLLLRKREDSVYPRVIEIGPGKQLGAMWQQTSKVAHEAYTHYSC